MYTCVYVCMYVGFHLDMWPRTPVCLCGLEDWLLPPLLGHKEAIRNNHIQVFSIFFLFFFFKRVLQSARWLPLTEVTIQGTLYIRITSGLRNSGLGTTDKASWQTWCPNEEKQASAFKMHSDSKSDVLTHMCLCAHNIFHFNSRKQINSLLKKTMDLYCHFTIDYTRKTQ